MNQHEKAQEAVRQIRRLLSDWLRTSKDSREPVADILQLLDTVDEHIRGSMTTSPKRAGSSAGRGSDATYTIDKKRNEEEVLSEHRQGGSSQPFRCPRYVYDAIAKALSDADAELDFEALMKAVTKLVPDPAEFQVRAALRFLLNVTPPILGRSRNRYRPLRGSKFEADAKAAWMALAKNSK